MANELLKITPENLFYKVNPFSKWDITHLAWGILVSYFINKYVTKNNKKNLLYSSLIHAGYEMKDIANTYFNNSFHSSKIMQFLNPDRGHQYLIDSIGDQISFTIGHFIFRELNKINKNKNKNKLKSIFEDILYLNIIFFVWLLMHAISTKKN